MIVARRIKVLGGALLVLLMALVLLPFASMFTTALHQTGTYPNGLDWPSQPQWGNFGAAFQAADMGAVINSSVLIVIAVVPVSVVIAAMAGFALGQLRIRGGQLVFLLFLLGLTLPLVGLIVPIFYEIQSMGLLNTRWAIILPLIGLYMPFGIFWTRAHFLTVPPEISEAARIDGANTWQLFWRVHVPLARSALSSLGILMAIWTWNQFLLPIVLVDYPLQGTMAGSLVASRSQWDFVFPRLLAGSLLILAPTIVVFVVFQRHFVAALLLGSLKG